MKRTGWRRWLLRGLKGVGALLLLALVVFIAGGWTSFGHRSLGSRRERIERSPQWRDGRFRNPQPLINDAWGTVKGSFDSSPDGSPKSPPPVEQVDRNRLATPPATGLRVTWFGHSTVLVEIDGVRVLTDPMWSERVSPLSWVGPRRFFPPLIALEALPPIDAVVISHDHYDHLDHATIAQMKDWNTTFIVPLGVAAHLLYWGVPAARIVELDWWEKTRVGGLEIVCTPARHASGRTLLDNDSTLWAGYALIGTKHRAFYSGDTGLFPAMRDIGNRLGPFDLTMIEIGQYDRAWPDWHIGPEQAVQAHAMLRGRVLLPVHWDLFQLAFHGWTEPMERALSAAQLSDAKIIAPMPGQPMEPQMPNTVTRWWPRLEWKTAKEDPIVSSGMN